MEKARMCGTGFMSKIVVARLNWYLRKGSPVKDIILVRRAEWKNIELVRKICEILNNLAGRGPGGDNNKLIHFCEGSTSTMLIGR
jgi:hypothetical protein